MLVIQPITGLNRKQTEGCLSISQEIYGKLIVGLGNVINVLTSDKQKCWIIYTDNNKQTMRIRCVWIQMEMKNSWGG